MCLFIVVKYNNDKQGVRPSKKKPHVSRPDFYKKRASGRLFFVIYYFLLHAFFTHYYLPQGYVGALRSNINKTKHQILLVNVN